MRIADTGVLVRGRKDSALAMHTFPTFTRLSNGSVIATARAGSTKDSDDETVMLYRSEDHGRSWVAEGAFAGPTLDGNRGSLKLCYITEPSPGHLLGVTMWVDRQSYPGQPLFNPETEGCLPMAVLLADSDDFGGAWSQWRQVPMPIEIGPPSLTSPILKLPDGRLLMSIETNKTYHDASKWYQRVAMFHSADGGKTWSGPTTASQDPTGRIYNWDQRACVSPDGRVATFAWTYQSDTKTYVNIHRRLSADSGLTWSEPEDLGITDQAGPPAVLPDGRVVLPWVDRFKTQTIRARVAASVDAPFDPDSEVVVYEHGGGRSRDSETTADLLVQMGLWTFGLPFAVALPDGDVLVAHYAGNDAQLDIRWVRLVVD